MRGGLITLFAAALLAGACSSSAEPAAPTTSSGAPTSTVSTSTVLAPPGDAAATTEETLQWVLDFLNEPVDDPDVVAARFSPAFLQQVPATQLVAVPAQINTGATGPWTMTQSQIDGFNATARIEAPGVPPLTVTLTLNPEPPNLIEGLLFQPVTSWQQVGSLTELEAELDAFAPISRVGLYDITEGRCAAVHERNADTPMPIGSTFKLWILAELAHQVESGEASWDEVFPVQDRYKASPDGEIFSLAEGTDVTLQRYAELMISISDNSATDHLLFRLGRERVEAAMTPSGVEEPDLNIPFLSAADLFMIKFSPDGPNSTDYRAADRNERRAILDRLTDEVVPWISGPQSFPLTNADGVGVDQPRDHDLEWFATPVDLCRTQLYLAELAERPGLEPVADILRINDTAGMPFDRSVWTDLRYKGGSELGIVAVAWRMERADGRVFVLAGGVESPDDPIDAAAAVSLLQQYANFTE
ncbi:MAG: hypothetical protein HKN26_08155 [Acidimicrobiales bacterium]|nr:hypothetical protein [Acidimicrobiales bacterium]